MEPEVKLNLRCGGCGYSNDIYIGSVGYELAIYPCGEHGSHTSVALVMTCPSCEKDNAVEIQYEKNEEHN